MTPDKLIRPEILALKAYHVADAEGMVKLDAMENPYPLPAQMRRELGEVLSRVDLNRYPDPTGRKLRELLAKKMNVPAGMEILLGNGSDDLIQIVTFACARPGAAMMFPAPTFVEAIKQAQSRYGKRVVTGEEVRWGAENLNLDAGKIKALGFGDMVQPLKTSCADHEGVRRGRVHTWDGKDWSYTSDWYEADMKILGPMIKTSAKAYAAEKKITRRTPEDCQS